jgi:hypothetical protein
MINNAIKPYEARSLWRNIKTAAAQQGPTLLEGLAHLALDAWASSDAGTKLSADRATREALVTSLVGAAIVDETLDKLAADGSYTLSEIEFLRNLNAESALRDFNQFQKNANVKMHILGVNKTLRKNPWLATAGGTLAGTTLGGALGAGIGAVTDSEDPVRGALRYGLAGAATGAALNAPLSALVTREITKGNSLAKAINKASKKYLAKSRDLLEIPKLSHETHFKWANWDKSKLYKKFIKNPIIPSIGGAITGGIMGAGAGALADDDDRLRGALRLGLMGAALGGASGYGYGYSLRGLSNRNKFMRDSLSLVREETRNLPQRKRQLENAYKEIRETLKSMKKTQPTPHLPAVQQAPHPPAVQQAPHPPAVQQAPHPPAVQQAPHPPAKQPAPQQTMVQQAPHPPAVQQAPHPPAVQQAPQQTATKSTPMLTPKEELIDTYNFRHKNLARLEKQLKNAKTREEKAEIQYWINSVKKEIKDIEKELIEKFNFKPSIKA